MDIDRNRARAQDALDAYLTSAYPSFPAQQLAPADIETALVDLVADLLHLADSHGVTGEYVLDRARGYYVEELNGVP